MLGKKNNQNQTNMFSPLLTDFINLSHELVLLSKDIKLQNIENQLSKFYSHTGKPSVNLRFMVGCLILKRIYNLGDETLAKAWVSNPYMQFFCGEAYFQHKFRCDPSDFVHFRRRIGEEGIELIFQESVRVNGKDTFSGVSLSDTTVQEITILFQLMLS
jgi:transposase, IS5 family